MILWKKIPGILNTHDEIAEFREIFSLVDKDGSGTITQSELGELLKIIGIEATDEDVEKMVRGVDSNSNGEVDFEEFVMFMTTKVDPGYSPDQVKKAFQIVQEEKGTSPGFVKLDDIAEFLSSHSIPNLTKEQAYDLASQLESDQNGLVEYNEYVDMMMRW